METPTFESLVEAARVLFAASAAYGDRFSVTEGAADELVAMLQSTGYKEEQTRDLLACALTLEDLLYDSAKTLPYEEREALLERSYRLLTAAHQRLGYTPASISPSVRKELTLLRAQL